MVRLTLNATLFFLLLPFSLFILRITAVDDLNHLEIIFFSYFCRMANPVICIGLYLLTPNEDELPVLCSETALTTENQIKELLGRGVQNIWLHKGKAGSALYKKTETLQLSAPEAEVVDCTGAGDGSVAGFLFSKYHTRDNLTSLRTAHTLSAEILQVNGAIATHLNEEKLLLLVSKYYSE